MSRPAQLARLGGWSLLAEARNLSSISTTSELSRPSAAPFTFRLVRVSPRSLSAPNNYFHKLWAYRTPWRWERGPYFDTRLMSSGMAGTNQADGSACTCIATSTAAVPQNQPTVAACNPYFVQSMDAGGCVVGVMDGTARTVTSSISGTTWVRLLWPNDGLPVGNY